ncbi:MAG: alpha/beta hydrolase [Solobacterium sp.]|nr:alpha/beta hydrolase [Solobacterium sp.]
MKSEVIVLNEERNVTLTAYIQDVNGEFGFAKRPAMLVLPGGGYAMCSDREADPVAMAYLQAGYQAFILRYTTSRKGKWPMPLEDYEEAMELIRNRSEEWYIDTDKIAVSGFSAGGHLAAVAATQAKNRPAAAVLVYPAVLKDIVDMCQPNMPYPHEHVSSKTCPCFLVACRDDKTVDITNTLKMELALAENNIPFESHIYSFGGHGFSTGEDWIVTNGVSQRVPNWTGDSISWMKEVLGKLTYRGFEEPEQRVSLNADGAPVLSIACSLGHMLKQNKEAQDLLKPMYEGMEMVAKARGYQLEGLYAVLSKNTISEIMEMLQMPSNAVKEIDSALHKMINEI